MEQKSLDRCVLAVLNAVDMEQYVPLFEKYEITWELLTAFTEDDCKVLGIDDPEHIRTLVKHVKEYRTKRQPYDNYVLPTIENVLEALHNSENHTRVIDVSTDYVNSTIQPEKCFDKPIGDGKSLTSAIQLFCDRVECEKDKLIEDIDHLTEEMKTIQKTEMKKLHRSRGYVLRYVITAAALFALVAILHKRYLQSI